MGSEVYLELLIVYLKNSSLTFSTVLINTTLSSSMGNIADHDISSWIVYTEVVFSIDEL